MGLSALSPAGVQAAVDLCHFGGDKDVVDVINVLYFSSQSTIEVRDLRSKLCGGYGLCTDQMRSFLALRFRLL